MVETIDEISQCWVGGAVIDPYQPDRVPRCLVVPSIWTERPEQEPNLKLPGGMHKNTDKDFEATLRRELLAETGLRIKQGAIINSPTHLKLGEQRKYFFILLRKQCRGTLRREPIIDGDTLLGPPRWLNYSELEAQLFYKHQFILPELKEFLVSKGL